MNRKYMKKAKKFVQKLIKLLYLIVEELNYNGYISLSNRIWGIRKGFLSTSVEIWNLNNTNYTNYLNDIQRTLKTYFINENYAEVLDDKLIFSNFMSNFSEYIPVNYFYIKLGQIYALDKANHHNDLLNVLIDKSKLIVKPVSDWGGKNINLLEYKENNIYLNDKKINSDELEKFIIKQNKCIVSEFIEQSYYSKNIYSNSCNTIRIITMWDYEINKPFIAASIHRFGCRESGHVDNFSKGGLCSLINEKNRLSKGIRYKINKKIEYFDKHPDTNEQIEDIEVLNFNFVKEKILEIAESMPYIPYVGWDLVITNESFKIIEGNNFPGTNIIQLHKPLLSNEKIKKFYEVHGIKT